MGICTSLFRDSPLTPEELRRLVKIQIVVFSIINTIISIVTLAATDNSEIERSAIIASLVLLWASFPVGMWGIYKKNGGVTALYIIFGVLCGAIRVTLSLIAAATVVVSCQTEQVSFKGCFQALDSLSCLRYSNCTSDILDGYNSLSTTTVECTAWSLNDCSNAPSGDDSYASKGTLILLIINVLTSCVPVYMAFLYFTRSESSNSSNEQQRGAEVSELEDTSPK